MKGNWIIVILIILNFLQLYALLRMGWRIKEYREALTGCMKRYTQQTNVIKNCPRCVHECSPT
jgi:hypothetical protein